MFSVDQLRSINRKEEVAHDGLMVDLLWSDPEEGWPSSPLGGWCRAIEPHQRFAIDCKGAPARQ